MNLFIILAVGWIISNLLLIVSFITVNKLMKHWRGTIDSWDENVEILDRVVGVLENLKNIIELYERTTPTKPRKDGDNKDGS